MGGPESDEWEENITRSRDVVFGMWSGLQAKRYTNWDEDL